MGMMQEFKEFAVKGNVVDLAVGLVIGAAFATIVKSLVNDVIMPPVGLLIGDVDFSKMKWVLEAAAADGTGGTAIAYGAFINTIITFIIIALVIFFVIKGMNKLKREKEDVPSKAPAADIVLLTEIRDLLDKQQKP